MQKTKVVLNSDTSDGNDGFSLVVVQEWCKLMEMEVNIYPSSKEHGVVTIYDRDIKESDTTFTTTSKPIDFKGKGKLELNLNEIKDIDGLLNEYGIYRFDLNEFRYDPRFIQLIEELNEKDNGSSTSLFVIEYNHESEDDFPEVVDLPIVDIEFAIPRYEMQKFQALSPIEQQVKLGDMALQVMIIMGK